jgi:hypothetical protein
MLGSWIRVSVGTRCLVLETPVQLAKRRSVGRSSVARIISLFWNLFVMANLAHRADEALATCGPESPKLWDGRRSSESLYVLSPKNEVVVQFADYEEKVGWTRALRRMQQQLHLGMCGFQVNFVGWLDVSVGRNIPAVMNLDWCSF